MMQILNALVVFANLLIVFTKASASAARINEVFDVKTSMAEGAGSEPDENAPAIELKNVSFTYCSSPSPALTNISLTVPAGASVGVLGGTGSGKTTLVSLITRLYDATEGSVNIFGRNVKEYSGAQLRKFFGIAPQKAVLFAGSVRENIKWGKEDATDDEISRALEISQSAEFVNSFKDGLDTVISQGGKNLSGGQRQRLTIARALVARPKILILDDSSSALDFATDARLRKALEKMRRSDALTTVTVSQRAAGVRHCDIIVVMDDGAISATGTHEQLISSSELYREICLSQNKEDELK